MTVNRSFEASAGRIRVRDVGGRVAFDTQQRVFAATDYLTGTLSISARSCLGTQVTLDQSTELGDCHPDATAVLGSFGLFYPGTVDGGIPAGGWWCAGGSYVHALDGRGQYSDRFEQNSGSRGNLTHMSVYSFRADSGKVYLDEQCYLAKMGSVTAGMIAGQNAFDIYYRLLVGVFDA